MSEATVAAPVRQAAAPEAGAKNRLVLQRQCACGQHTAGGGECAECRKKRMAMQRWPSQRPRPDAVLRAASTMPAPAAAGGDLSRVPAQTPALRTAPMVQRADADGSGAFEPAEVEQAAQDSVDPAFAPPSPEAETPAGAPESPGAEAAPQTPAAAPGASLLVEDGATEVGAGQMRKTEFLDQLQRTVCAEADQALAAAGRSTEGCPFIAQAFGRYRGQSAARVESALRRYAPETRNARTAAETIPILAARVRQGVERWVETGEITGVPDDAPISIPTGGLFGAISSAASGIGSLLFKAKEGGAHPGDPAAVHEELGDGRPLENGVRGRMERAFGRSFSGVRMHTDATARRLSTEQNARAFTVGGHVAFAAGEYRPGTMAGDALIAHELAHTVQQGSGAAVQAKAADGAGYDALEADADRSATGVVASLWGAAKETAGKLAHNTGPALRSGLSIQRCSKNTPKTATPGQQPGPGAPGTAGPGATAAPGGEKEKEKVEAPPKPAEPEQVPEGGWCAQPADHAGLIALLKQAGRPEPVGTLSYGFTFWRKKDTTKLPGLSIVYSGTSASTLTGRVQPTTTSFGTMDALYLKPGTYELPGKKFNVTDSQCGAGGKQVPLFSTVSDEMSQLARRAEQEHCDDYHRAFQLSYVQQAANINSLVGTAFGPGTKPQIRAQVKTALDAKGDKGIQGWIDEVNRLAAISQTVRDDGKLHRLDPDGAPTKVDASCTRKDATTVRSSTTKIPGPKTEDIIK